MEKVRLSLDVSCEFHMFLKMKAAKEGVSIREYVLESIAMRGSQECLNIDIDDKTFNEALEKTRKDHKDFSRKLSKL